MFNSSGAQHAAAALAAILSTILVLLISLYPALSA